MAAQAFIGLGSNTGDRVRAIGAALVMLEALADGGLSGLSGLYETSPLDIEGGPFLNAVVCMRTAKSPRRLLRQLQRIEKDMGRDRDMENAGARIIDLDLLLFADVRMNAEDITLPHPRMRQRRFVMEPLAEIAPELTIPPDGLPASRIAAELTARFPEQIVKRLGTVEEIGKNLKSEN